MSPYTKCGIMSLLLKEVVRFYSPVGKVWCVSIGGRQIGWIRRGDTIKGWHQYTAISIMGCEYGEFDNFMQALSLFIDNAIHEISSQGSKVTKYMDTLYVNVETDRYCIIKEALYDDNDEVYYYIVSDQNQMQSYISPFELRYQTLMGFIEF